MIWRVGEYSAFSYRGGMVLLSVATAGVVAAAAIPGTAVGLALGWRPLRWIGARSYGIYLWHFPVIVLTTAVNTKPSLLRVAIQVAAVVIIAALSWKFVEEPIRHGALNRLWANVRAAGSAARAGTAGRVPTMTTFSGLAATAGITGLLIVAGVGLSGASARPGTRRDQRRLGNLVRVAEPASHQVDRPSEVDRPRGAKPRPDRRRPAAHLVPCRGAHRGLDLRRPGRTPVPAGQGADRGSVRGRGRADRSSRTSRAHARSWRPCQAR